MRSIQPKRGRLVSAAIGIAVGLSISGCETLVKVDDSARGKDTSLDQGIDILTNGRNPAGNGSASEGNGTGGGGGNGASSSN